MGFLAPGSFYHAGACPDPAGPKHLTARLYPGARWRGAVSSSDGVQTVAMRPVGLDEKLLVTGALGLALAAAFWPRGRR